MAQFKPEQALRCHNAILEFLFGCHADVARDVHT
jgi:hypothetical protein